MCKMCKLLVILLCLVVAVTLEYDLKCPDSGEWRLRAVGFNCSIKSQYVCIFKYPERTYHETCDGLDYSSIGSKLIYEPFFNKAYCSYERYQPFPFSTDGNSKCVYEKSFCTEKGQYLFQRGSQRSDITCGCDLTKGYEFVTKPNQDCYCVPSAEDCSCYKIPCNNLVDQCPQDRDEILTTSMLTTFQENRFKDAINIFDDKNNGKTYRFQCLYISSALLACMIIVVILFLTMVTVFEHLQEIKKHNMDDYIEAIKSRTEIRRYVKIHVIGKEGVGKSSLVRRLVGESIMKLNSTDGIDIVKKCKIRTTDGKWVIGKEIQKDQDKMTSENLVECGLWDFAGQKDYYATHQTFLNPHAIYLLVTNIMDDLTDIENETDFDSIEEYIDFWFDSIHCLRSKNIPMGYPKHRLYPPVIVVCTHIDKYKTVKEFEKRKTEYIERFEEIFGGQDKANHNRGIYFISNTEFLESDCKKLKDKIYEVANETMFFEEELPTQWIQLENALSVLKNELKQNILSFRNIVELSKITSIEEKQLLPFLTYQHKIGNIIFFKDIREYIILQPEWLVKCFRCLVCDDHAFKRNHAILKSTDWQHLKNTGQLSDDIIDRLFEKEPELEFGKYKTHILHVMEKFDIIVKPQLTATNNDSSLIHNSYYMPCMITTQSTSLDIIQKSFGSEKSSFSSSPWLILEFKFLPLAYFNYILFYYIARYTVCEKAGQKTLYRGKALVNLDKTGLRKLCVCFSKNAIAFQVWTLSDVEDNMYSTILEELCKEIEELKKRLRQSMSYDIKVKCSNGDYSNKKGRITFKELGEMSENGRYLCPEHNEMHSKDDVEKTWLQHADIVIAKLNKEQTENNPRNIVENEPIKEETFTHDQASVKNNLPVSVTLRKQINIEDESPFIDSCIKTGNTLVFTDSYNDRLIICNSDGNDIHHIPLPYRPCYITQIDSNTVAVSCTDNNTILIINISTRSITSTINIIGYCRGISYNDNNLYGLIGMNIIHVMDLTGNVIRTIPVPTGDIRDITVDRDRLVCIDNVYKSIYCCSLDGNLMWKFKMDEFQDLTGMTTDNDGNVYVIDYRKDTVLVVSDDGKHHKKLLTESDGLDRPWGIYYDKTENSLLVCNNSNGNAFLFDVIKKLT